MIIITYDNHDNCDVMFQSMPVMYALLSGEAGCKLEPYVNILRDEPVLQNGFMRLLQDLVVFAVHRGANNA